MPELSPKQVNTTSKSVERPKGFNIRDSINKLQQKLDLSLTATSNLLVPRPRKNDQANTDQIESSFKGNPHLIQEQSRMHIKNYHGANYHSLFEVTTLNTVYKSGSFFNQSPALLQLTDNRKLVAHKNLV